MLAGGHLFDKTLINRINVEIDENPALSRYGLSRQVCDWLNWRGVDGELKDMSCRVALLKLHRQGLIDLPEAKQGLFPDVSTKLRPLEFEQPLIEVELNELGKISLILVDSSQSRQWNHMMDSHHYLGSGPLCGAQLRYLIHSEQGWLGGLSFSAPAWRVADRDHWIGWDDAGRAARLQRIVCNSRFLILPQVKIKNLASKVLSKAIKQLPGDWQARYGEAPLLLESYVDRSRFRGSCYRAANWQWVGCTQGRGRQDGGHQAKVTRKDIYLYPLTKDCRTILQGDEQGVRSTRTDKPIKLVQTRSWAEEEFGCNALGDQRLTNRLVSLAQDFYARPQANIPQACGTRAKTKAAYRFFDHSRTDMKTLLQSHIEATTRRIAQHKVVLAVQDTTSLNYSAHPATEDIGLIGSHDPGPIGLMVHDTLSFNLDGTPLGLLDVQCWSRDRHKFARKHLKQLPIEHKESYKWLKSYQAVANAQAQCPDTQMISVGDREADLYELFHLANQEPEGPALLVRASHNRTLKKEQGRLWDYMNTQPCGGTQDIQVPRKGNQRARTARMSVYYACVELQPPRNLKDYPAVKVWAVLSRENDAPSGIKALEWMLLSTLEVNSFEQACEKLAWYTVRWGIEMLHRTLKSGCKLEQRQLGNASRIEACLAIDIVVAWRIYHLVKLGRETPDASCEVYFEQAQWKALVAFVNKDPVAPTHAPTLRQATHMLATLGGYLGRKGDGEPGAKALWLGLQRLDDITATWKVCMDMLKDVPHLSKNTVSSKMDYG